MSERVVVPYDDHRVYPPQEVRRRATRCRDEKERRRTVRDYSDRAVPDIEREELSEMTTFI